MPFIRTASGSSGSLFRRAFLAVLCLGLGAPLAHAQTTPAVSTIVALSISNPAGNLVRGADGLLYGVAVPSSSVAAGLIYSATLDGVTVKTIYQMNGADAVTPRSGLLLASDGKFYATTKFGRNTDSAGAGTIYTLNTDGTGFTVIHRFDDYTSTNVNSDILLPIIQKNVEGAFPEGELIDGGDLYLYGTASAGGTNGTGTVFKILRDGTGIQKIHEFAAITSTAASGLTVNVDGANSVAPLLRLSDGFLYGTASTGGPNGQGVVFRVATDGSGFLLLHVFTAMTTNATTGLGENADGAVPLAGLTDGGDGFLYGVTSLGGANGAGVIFAVAPDGSNFKVQHNFDPPNGTRPTAELLLGSDGMFYGTTAAGGQSSTGTTTSFGTIFSAVRVAAGTGITRLYSFDGTQGSAPTSRLIEIGSNKFVGTTIGSGACGYGTVYQYSGTGETVTTGNTKCGRTKAQSSGGGSIGPAFLVLLGGFGWARRRRRIIYRA